MMDAITLSVEIREDRRLIIDLPSDTPLGTAEIIIRPIEKIDADQLPPIVANPAREAARAKLAAAGFLSTLWKAPEDFIRPSDQELQVLGRRPAGSKSLDQLIDEDRGLD